VTTPEIAVLLKEYGPWGLVALLTGAVIKLYRDKEALSTGYIERLIAGLVAATSAAQATREALSELAALIESTGKAVAEHDHRIAILIEKVQHGFGNTSSSLDGVARELQRIRDRDDHRGRS